MNVKAFLSKYKKDIGKLFTTHFIIAVFGLMVYLPWDQTKDYGKTLAIISSVVAILFYYYLIDLQIWDRGALDKLNSDSRKEPLNLMTGLFLGLIAAIPSFVFGIIYNILWQYQTYEWAANPAYIFSLITGTWEGAFLGIKVVALPNFPYFFLMTPFIPVLFTMISYILGAKNIVIIPRPKKERN